MESGGPWLGSRPSSSQSQFSICRIGIVIVPTYLAGLIFVKHLGHDEQALDRRSALSAASVQQIHLPLAFQSPLMLLRLWGLDLGLGFRRAAEGRATSIITRTHCWVQPVASHALHSKWSSSEGTKVEGAGPGPQEGRQASKQTHTHRKAYTQARKRQRQTCTTLVGAKLQEGSKGWDLPRSKGHMWQKPWRRENKS